MSHGKILALVVIALVGFEVRALAQPGKTEKNQQPIVPAHKLLDEHVDTKPFLTNIPLARFLERLEQQLPKEKRLALRVEAEAFGDKLAEVVATPVVLRPFKTTLRGILEAVVAQIKVKADYRVAGNEIAITTPERALYTVVHDIRDIVARPDNLTLVGSPLDAFQERRRTTPAQKTAEVLQAMVAASEQFSARPVKVEQDTVRILNGSRLVIRANASSHHQFAETLQAFRRAAEVAVVLKAELHEVTEAQHAKLLQAKRVDWEEAERKFLSGTWVEGELSKQLKKSKPIQAGEEVKIDNCQGTPILSRHNAVVCLASPGQVRKGENRRTIVLEGVSFLAGVRVSWDRRYVWVKLTEKATDVLEIQKTQVRQFEPSGKEQIVPAEIPVLKQSALTQVWEIADGGTMLIPVHYRPRSAKEHDRRWVLSITSRIYLEEEERQIREDKILPVLRP